MKNLKILLLTIFLAGITFISTRSNVERTEVRAASISENKSEALWFNVNANITVNALRVQGTIYNGYGRPIFCQGRVYGVTRSGHTLWSEMSGVLYPGRYSTVYVYTTAPNYFVNGYGDINCRF